MNHPDPLAPFVPTFPSFVHGLPAPVYHGTPGILSATGMKTLLRCPAVYRYKIDHPEDEEKTKALTFGDIAHLRLFNQAHAYAPLSVGHNGTTREGKAETNELLAAGKIPVKRDVWDASQAMVDAIYAHPLLRKALGAGYPEVSMFWEDGVKLRARADWLPDKMPIILDYKTTVSCVEHDLMNSMVSYGYALQAAHYEDATRHTLGEHRSFVLIFQEKTPPYLVVVAQPNEAAMAYGRQQVAQAKALYAQCQETGVWPGYADDVIQLGLPGWVTKRKGFVDE